MGDYLKLFETDNDRLTYEDGQTYIEPYVSYVEADNTVHYNKPPFFCKLTLSDDSVVEIEGSGELTKTMLEEYSYIVGVEIGTLCTSIGEYAFEDIDSLTSVTISDSVTSIDDYAFYMCVSLSNIVIPNNITSIGNGAFESCEGLISVSVESTNPPTLGNSAFDYTTCLIYVPNVSVETYKTASGWSTWASRIQAIPTT